MDSSGVYAIISTISSGVFFRLCHNKLCGSPLFFRSQKPEDDPLIYLLTPVCSFFQRLPPRSFWDLGGSFQKEDTRGAEGSKKSFCWGWKTGASDGMPSVNNVINVINWGLEPPLLPLGTKAEWGSIFDATPPMLYVMGGAWEGGKS